MLRHSPELSPASVALVQQSFASLLPQADTVAALFYQQLFELDPELKRLFRSDPERQGERLMQMLALAIGQLSRPAQLRPVLHALGRRHVAYGVRPMHYATVGSALLRTLQLGLGERFSAELLEAWSEVYAMIALTMQEDLVVTVRSALAA